MKILEPLFVQDHSPKMLWYSNGLPSAANQPKRIPIESFMAIYQDKGYKPFKYTETIWYDHSYKSMLARKHLAQNESDLAHSVNVPKSLQPLLCNPTTFTDKLIISYIDSKVGFGVFARETIALNQIICLYSGWFTAIGSCAYSLSIPKIFPLDWQINAEEFGGIGRFFCHMPKPCMKNINII